MANGNRNKMVAFSVDKNGNPTRDIGSISKNAAYIAFENMGGVEGLTEWGIENRSDFYKNIFTKLIKGSSTVQHVGHSGGSIELEHKTSEELDRLIQSLVKTDKELSAAHNKLKQDAVDVEFSEVSEENEDAEYIDYLETDIGYDDEY